VRIDSLEEKFTEFTEEPKKEEVRSNPPTFGLKKEVK